MDYTDVKNPAYAAADGSVITCEVKFDAFEDYVSFAAAANDLMDHGREIYADLAAGKYGAIEPYVAPPLTPDQQYVAAIAQGIEITSASVPQINATFGVTDADQADISSEAQFIGLYGEFTNGDAAFAWPDVAGVLREFPDTATFMLFAKAAARYVSACKQAKVALKSGAAADWPSNVIELE
ncbi:hypothetical protein [Paraburkholderia tuberum]|uniref:DUF4376 domain-containing protein n=1 Tax=Paraburkholderia tuberum TaxID=157910 RepID=A0A1H1JTL5_9BURK|nr:hypothetical protein [Paraburkholderia tuberum]SDR52965.1 hypothetical protein SAMN05445850_5582 [Paraburkholderia tuberum]